MTKGGKASENLKEGVEKRTLKKASLKVKVLKSREKKPLAKAKVAKVPARVTRALKKKPVTQVTASKTKTVVTKPAPQKEKATNPPISKEKARILSAKVERDKLFLVRAGVTFIMLLLVGLWIFSIKYSLLAREEKTDETFSVDALQEVTASFSEKIEQINLDLNQVLLHDEAKIKADLDSQSTPQSERQSPFAEASSSLPLLIERLNNHAATSAPAISQAQVDELKQRFEELEQEQQDL